MGISVVPVVYDLGMTYITGMITDDGILIAADGLIRRWDNDKEKWLDSNYEGIKSFPLTNHIVVAFAGALPEGMSNVIDGYKVFLEQHKPTLVRDVATNIAEFAFRTFEDILKRQNSDLEVIVGGFDLDANYLPVSPRLYFLSYNDRNPGCFDVVNAGFYQDIGIDLTELYNASLKDIKSLISLSEHAINKSANKYPTDVGGNHLMYHITEKGVQKIDTKL